MTTQALLNLNDDISYQVLRERQPRLIETIEQALAAGATAAAIEMHVFRKYGLASLMAAMVAGAAYYIEKERETPNAP